MNIQKDDGIGSKLIEGLSHKGFAKCDVTIPEELKMSIFGHEIHLGKFKVRGNITTDLPPPEIIEKYTKMKKDESMKVKMISLAESVDIKFIDWPKKVKQR